MQKKRWIVTDKYLHYTNRCGKCFLCIMPQKKCVMTLKLVEANEIHKSCPLIEAETREEVMQKMFDIFKKDYNKDDWNRFMDDFKNLIQDLGDGNVEK